jgi:hypothetical protein
LLIKSSRLVEEYRRFYFPDVQAIVIRRTMPFHYGWAAFLFAVTLVTGRIFNSGLPAIGILAVSALFLWLRGPACACHLHTAVRPERLPSLHRLKTARRVAEILRIHIERRQGMVESLSEYPTIPSPPPLPGSARLPSLQAARRASIKPHSALYGLLFTEAVTVALLMYMRPPWASSAIAFVSLLEFLVLLPLLAWQSGRNLHRPLKLITAAGALRWFLVHGFAWLGLYKVAIVYRTARDFNPLSVPLASGWLGWVNLISLTMTACAGLYFLWVEMRSGNRGNEG